MTVNGEYGLRKDVDNLSITVNNLQKATFSDDKTYEIKCNVEAITYKDGVYSPQEVVFTSYSIGRMGVNRYTKGVIKLYGSNDGVNYTWIKDGSDGKVSFNPNTLGTTYDYYRTRLFKNTTELDFQTIPVLKDGGSESGLVIMLGNEAVIIPCNSLGVVESDLTITVPFYAFFGLSRTSATTSEDNITTPSIVGEEITIVGIQNATSLNDGYVKFKFHNGGNWGGSDSGAIEIKITSNGKIISRNFNYAKSIKGVDGEKGDKGDKGDPGKDGKGISQVKEEYAISNSDTTEPASSEWSEGIKQPTATKKYLWNREVVYYTGDSTKHPLAGHVVAIYSKDGIITEINNYYTRSQTYSGIKETWQKNPSPIPAINSTWRYLWNKEEIKYQDGHITTTAERVIGVYGDKGEKGVDGDTTEFIFNRTKEPVKSTNDPYTLSPVQQKDYVPWSTETDITKKWTDDMQGVDLTYQYEWVSQRERIDGTWGKFTHPALWAVYSEDGFDGKSVEYIYKLESTTTCTTDPSTLDPVQEDDYVPWKTDSDVNKRWYDNAQTVTNEKPYLFMSKRYCKPIAPSTTATWQKFSKPVLFNIKGKDGVDGQYIEYVYKRFKKDETPILVAPTKYYNNITKKYCNFQDDDYLPLSEAVTVVTKESQLWTDDPSGPSEEYPMEYVSMRTKAYDETTKSYVWGSFMTPALWANYSEDGEDGRGLEFVFKLSTSNTTPPTLSEADWTDSSGKKHTFQDDDFVPKDWMDNASSIIGSDDLYKYQWMSKRTKVDGVWQHFSTPVIWAGIDLPVTKTELKKIIDNLIDNSAIEECVTIKNGSTSYNDYIYFIRSEYTRMIGFYVDIYDPTLYQKQDATTGNTWLTVGTISEDKLKPYKKIVMPLLDNSGYRIGVIKIETDGTIQIGGNPQYGRPITNYYTYFKPIPSKTPPSRSGMPRYWANFVVESTSGWTELMNLPYIPIIKNQTDTSTGEKYGVLQIKVTANNGSTLLTSKNVTFVINGVSYDRTTSSSGIASINIKLAAGTYENFTIKIKSGQGYTPYQGTFNLKVYDS